MRSYRSLLEEAEKTRKYYHSVLFRFSAQTVLLGCFWLLVPLVIVMPSLEHVRPYNYFVAGIFIFPMLLTIPGHWENLRIVRGWYGSFRIAKHEFESDGKIVHLSYSDIIKNKKKYL